MVPIIAPKENRLEVADILREHIADYRDQYPLWPEHRKIVYDLLSCRTARLGGHIDRCSHCGTMRITYHSCRNRHCPKCQHLPKYVKRWPIEVCFKECKQMLDFGKEQSNDFNAQVFATTASFLRYNILNYLNKNENHSTLGELFEYISDESAAISYAQRLWEFFRGLFLVSFSTIFDLFKKRRLSELF